MSAAIRLQSVTKYHQRGKERITIFDELDLDVAEGDFVAVMGPSGSGKTTLLNLIGGIDRPSAGAVMVDGTEIGALGEGRLADWRARNVGFIFQFYNLMPRLSARENVELPLLLTSMPARQRREHVQSALALVRLEDRLKHRPRELSGGQQQRVAIARAIVSDPRLILADEPTGDLDRETANEILELLCLLNTEFGKTIVMVTHDPDAAKFARRTLQLDKGRFTAADGERG